MLERLRKQLLKLDSIKRLVTDYRKRMKEQKRAERWAYLIHECQLYHSHRGQALEGHLRNGMTASEIGVKYDATRATIYNWIRSYGLQGIKGQKGEAVQESPPVTVVQESPTLPEIEQFHTDEPVQGLPKVDLEPSGMTEEENMTDAEWETRLKEGYSNGAVSADPAPRETFDEIWQDARSDLATLERLYVAQAKQSFRDRLREMLTEITGELGLKDV